MAASRRRLRIPDPVVHLLRGLHPGIKRKVRSALDELIEEPESGKALQRELAGLWSWRVGRFRIIYRIAEEATVEIVAFGPREVIYRETYRLIRKSAD